MDNHIKEFYCQFSDGSPKGNFHKVIPLHEQTHLRWSELVKLIPQLPRGWVELGHLSVQDRIEFLRDYWLSKLPYHPKLDHFLTRFFNALDDIGIYLIQRTFDDPFDANIVYSLKDNEGFFRGGLPASEPLLSQLQKSFPNYMLPKDYTAFLQIHNGFSKTTDVTGLIHAEKMQDAYEVFQGYIDPDEGVATSSRVPVNPKSLIPFYESFGMPFFQCFWGEWYPEQEMGNVYYSGLTKTISNVECSDPSAEGMAFPTFVDWLIFYMERIEE